MAKAAGLGERIYLAYPVIAASILFPHLKVTCAPHTQDDLARAAIPDRDLQLRLIHMLMGGRGSSSGANQQSPSTSSDSGNRKMHSGSSVSPGHDAAVSPVCKAFLYGVPGHGAAVTPAATLSQALSLANCRLCESGTGVQCMLHADCRQFLTSGL